ncbi:MAG: fructose-bisphosphatase class II, partial [Rhodospirillaceae bacterium]|nr:fructose-bisphosphatase class II [Rhodospirillaceae bacterium]
QMQGRLMFRNDDEISRARRWGIEDLEKKYCLSELAKGDVMFAATGVTGGTMLKGVKRFPGGADTHSIIMRSSTGTVRTIEAHHDWRRKPISSDLKV